LVRPRVQRHVPTDIGQLNATTLWCSLVSPTSTPDKSTDGASGIGLGCILARSRLVTPALLVAATQATASRAPILRDPLGGLLPDLADVREVSVAIAAAVIRAAVRDGLSQVDDIPGDETVLGDWIREQLWDAKYRPLRRVRGGEEATAQARGEVGTLRTH
jgi:malate dehydrogenase (oxaloacetate-decarboxylating)